MTLDVTRCFLDIETTGLTPGPHVILSIGVILNQGLYGDEFVIIPSKKKWDTAEPKALEVNGMTIEYLRKHGDSFNVARSKLLTWFCRHDIVQGKAVIVGQNIKFDIKFLKYFFGPDLAFFQIPVDDTVDNISLFKGLQKKDPSLRGAKWNTHAMSKALGVPEEPGVHTALEGAKAALRNYWAIMERYEELDGK